MKSLSDSTRPVGFLLLTIVIIGCTHGHFARYLRLYHVSLADAGSLDDRVSEQIPSKVIINRIEREFWKLGLKPKGTEENVWNFRQGGEFSVKPYDKERVMLRVLAHGDRQMVLNTINMEERLLFALDQSHEFSIGTVEIVESSEGVELKLIEPPKK